MPRIFSQLTDENRVTIESMRSQGRSMRTIASTLNVSPSTISREIARSGGKAADWYLAAHGQRARQRGRAAAGVSRRKLGTDTSSLAWRHVLNGLRVGWSPEQIAGRLKATSSAPCPPTPCPTRPSTAPSTPCLAAPCGPNW